MCEVELIKKSKSGNSSAFSNLIKFYEKDLYRVAIAMVKNNDDALDCIQDTILSAYKNIHKLNNEIYFKTWLIKILINNCNNCLCKRKKTISLFYNKEESSYEENFNGIDLKDAVGRLDRDLRILVILYYYEDLSVKEISDSLKIPEGTVKSRLSRARTRLKSILIDDNSEVL